jgi:hypothetical protein
MRRDVLYSALRAIHLIGIDGTRSVDEPAGQPKTIKGAWNPLLEDINSHSLRSSVFTMLFTKTLLALVGLAYVLFPFVNRN